jgi:hypothetical protein
MQITAAATSLGLARSGNNLVINVGSTQITLVDNYGGGIAISDINRVGHHAALSSESWACSSCLTCSAGVRFVPRPPILMGGGRMPSARNL